MFAKIIPKYLTAVVKNVGVIPMNVIDLHRITGDLIFQGLGEAKVYTSDGGAGVMEAAFASAYTRKAGEFQGEYEIGGDIEDADADEDTFSIHHN